MMTVAQKQTLHRKVGILIFCKECGYFLPGSGSSERARRDKDIESSVKAARRKPAWPLRGT